MYLYTTVSHIATAGSCRLSFTKALLCTSAINTICTMYRGTFEREKTFVFWYKNENFAAEKPFVDCSGPTIV